jgi:hypothetical protein
LGGFAIPLGLRNPRWGFASRSGFPLRLAAWDFGGCAAMAGLAARALPDRGSFACGFPAGSRRGGAARAGCAPSPLGRGLRSPGRGARGLAFWVGWEGKVSWWG